MATIIAFNPVPNQNFQFQATFDGQSYSVVLSWNIYGQRYYINIYDQNSNLVVCRSVVGSPDGYDISLTAGYFTTKLVYRASSNQFEVI